ncbi:MAG TPA: hypothetical protein V6C88_16705 [Chroococcidiopsis sp.]
MHPNAIILRNIPKSEVRIDLFRHEVQGGFRGFYSNFPLVGWHYVSVKADRGHVGFWCHLTIGRAVVRVFDASQGFVEDDPEAAQHYAQIALSGGMHQALLPYPDQLYAPWFGLVSSISANHFPPLLHSQDGGAGSRFDNALQGTHGGDSDAFLAEFQYAFVRWLISLDQATEDGVAFARWQHLLLAVCNAGEFRIGASSQLFSALVSVLIRQFDLLPREWLKGGSTLAQQINYLVEDLIDSDVEELGDRGRALAHFLEKYESI